VLRGRSEACRFAECGKWVCRQFWKTIRDRVIVTLSSHGAAATTLEKAKCYQGTAHGRNRLLYSRRVERPNPHLVKRQEGSGCVLRPRTLASIDGVWQHDVKYMCKYSTTSFIDYFNKIDHARSHCRRSAAGRKTYWLQVMIQSRPGGIKLRRHLF
jgi:hypothetical protein